VHESTYMLTKCTLSAACPFLAQPAVPTDRVARTAGAKFLDAQFYSCLLIMLTASCPFLVATCGPCRIVLRGQLAQMQLIWRSYYGLALASPMALASSKHQGGKSPHMLGPGIMVGSHGEEGGGEERDGGRELTSTASRWMTTVLKATRTSTRGRTSRRMHPPLPTPSTVRLALSP